MKSTVNPFSVTVPANGAQLLPYTPRRISILVSSDHANRFTLNWRGPAALDAGLTVQTATLPFVLHRDHIGSAIEQEVWAVGAVANQVISGWEVVEL
jgi:hypothetical protein